MGAGSNDVGLSRRHLQRALDASLRRLRRGLRRSLSGARLGPDDAARGDAADNGRHGPVRQGAVYRTVELHRLAGAESRHDGRRVFLTVPITLQPQYNLLVREVEWEIVPSCLDAGLGLLPWSPLGGGWLTGKYRRETAPVGATRLGEDPNRGVEAYDPRSAQERTWAVVDAVEQVADARGATMAQVALAWLTDRPAVTSVILGARTLEQLRGNLGAAGLHLEQHEIELLDRGQRSRAGRLSRTAAPGKEQRNRVLPAAGLIRHAFRRDHGAGGARIRGAGRRAADRRAGLVVRSLLRVWRREHNGSGPIRPCAARSAAPCCWAWKSWSPPTWCTPWPSNRPWRMSRCWV